MQALWMLLASAMYAVMGAFVKLSGDDGASLAEVVLFRGVPSVILLLGWARVGHRSIITHTWRLHVLRNLAGVTAMWLGFYAISHLKLSTATSLTYTSPLFIACWMLVWGGMRRDPVRIASVALGFAGVIVVLRPSISADQWLPAFLGLVGGLLTAIAMLQIRQLGREGEPEWRTVLFFSIAVCLSSIVVGAFFDGWGHADWVGFVSLVGVGLAGLGVQLAQTRAFGKGSALLTAALQYSTIIFAMLIGITFWNDALDAFAWLGSGLIILAGLVSVWRTARQTAHA
jgi:S-adenosylmethionine uptake transporter